MTAARAGRFNRLEFAVVIGIAFGQFVIVSVASLLAGPGGEGRLFDDGHLGSLLVYESIAGLLIGLILWRAGWRLRDFNLQPSWAATLNGVGLALAGWFVYYLAAILAQITLGGTSSHQVGADSEASLGGASSQLILLVSVVNPLFEEMLVCGYVIEALRRRFGIVVAVNVSTALRVAYHVYQGPFAFLWVAMMGLLFAYAYVKWRNLWPLVLAHGIHDYVALSAL